MTNMETLRLIVILLCLYLIAFVECSIRPSNLKKELLLSDGGTSFDSRSKWKATEGEASRSIDGRGEMLSSEKKQMRKSDHYIDPKILKQLNGVNDIKEFVKKFKPKDFTIKTEKVLRKLKKTADKKPNQPAIGVAGTSLASLDFSTSDSRISDDDFQEVEEETVYYKGQKVADPFQFGSSTKDPCIPKNVTQSIGRFGIRSIPSCVVLKKCGGCCGGGKECVALKTASKTIPVLEISRTATHFVHKTFTDDVSCECGCIVKASDCLPTQTYSSDRCQCECHSQQSCPIGKHWSKAECNCICSKRPSCNSPLRMLDESSCNCVCTDTKCPDGQSRSPENCQCL